MAAVASILQPVEEDKWIPVWFLHHLYIFLFSEYTISNLISDYILAEFLMIEKCSWNNRMKELDEHDCYTLDLDVGLRN
jgi:hypothetical protein